MGKNSSKTQNRSKSTTQKSGSVRSRAYPAVDLKSAIQLVSRQIQSLGSDAHSREVIAQSLGHAKSSGPAARKIAAMSHFGLLERANGLYKPTPLAKKLLQSDSTSLATSRREAFLKPTLFQEVFNLYRPTGRLPELLGPTLAQSHGISKSVQEEVAEIFRESGVFAGVLTRGGEFVGPRPAPMDPVRELPSTERAEPAPAAHDTGEPEAASIKLTYGEAQIQLPSRLTPGDFRRLKALLSVYEPTEEVLPQDTWAGSPEGSRFQKLDA